ncbi:MAG: hypothetical protein QM772_14435 [Ottowia sp.]|uniref:hypothetical protein n=1 Tax=Ottowia sp. TaxID=1898956 RepID=UPI0039E28025
MRRLIIPLCAGVLSVAWAQEGAEGPFTCDRTAAITPLAEVAFTGEVASYTDAERACWADWPQAQALAQGLNGQWVDVRDAGSARRIALRGAATVGLTDLADKAFLKGQSLVLVGTGVDLKALTERCVALRQRGQFSGVHVLLGGARTWRLAGQPVQADGTAVAPDEASAQELWLGAAGDLWQLAVFGLSAEQRQSLPVPASRVLDLGADARRAVDELQRRATTGERLAAPRQWLVVAPDAAQLAQAQALWRERAQAASPLGAPIWLSGGWQAYAAYLQQQKTLAAHAGRPLPRLCGM